MIQYKQHASHSFHKILHKMKQGRVMIDDYKAGYFPRRLIIEALVQGENISAQCLMSENEELLHGLCMRLEKCIYLWTPIISEQFFFYRSSRFILPQSKTKMLLQGHSSVMLVSEICPSSHLNLLFQNMAQLNLVAFHPSLHKSGFQTTLLSTARNASFLASIMHASRLGRTQLA